MKAHCDAFGKVEVDKKRGQASRKVHMSRKESKKQCP
jgi:hypothetical protein